MKHEIGTLSHWRYRGMLNKLFSKNMKNSYNCVKQIFLHAIRLIDV